MENKMNPPPQDGGWLGALKRTSSFGGSGEGPDVYKLALGKDVNELANEGQQAYPDVPVSSRHHALASKLATEKYGFIPTQLAGLAVEGGEALMGGMKNPHWKEDTINDVKANFRGGIDGLRTKLQSLRALIGKKRSAGSGGGW